MAQQAPAPATEDIPCNTPCHIVKTPGFMQGRARIKGSRIRVMDLVGLARVNGYSPEDLAAQFDWVPKAAIYAAFAYYFDHEDEVEREIVEANDFAERFRREHPEMVHELSQ